MHQSYYDLGGVYTVPDHCTPPPPHFFVPGEKVPFFGNESALFSWNRSAVFAKRKCPFWSVPPHFRGVSAASGIRIPFTHARAGRFYRCKL